MINTLVLPYLVDKTISLSTRIPTSDTLAPRNRDLIYVYEMCFSVLAGGTRHRFIYDIYHASQCLPEFIVTYTEDEL